MNWQPIETFDPAVHTDQYWFSDGLNIVLGHWYEGEREPRMAYSGQGGDGDFPIFVTHWMMTPEPPNAPSPSQ